MESTVFLNEARELLEKIEKAVKDERLSKELVKAENNLDYVIRNLKYDNVDLAKLIRDKANEVYSKLSSTRTSDLPRDAIEELKRLIKWCGLAVYDFTERARDVKRAYRAFIWGMIIFFILGGSYAQPFAISALVLALPAIMAMSFLKRRRATGYILAITTVPLPLVIFVNIVFYTIYALSNPDELSSAASQFGLGTSEFAVLLALIMIGGIIGLALLSYAVATLYKTRDAYY